MTFASVNTKAKNLKDAYNKEHKIVCKLK